MANTYISRTHSGTATNTKKITYSAWLKFGTDNATEAILVEWLDGNHRVEFLRLDTGEIRFEWVDGGSNSAYFKTKRKFRDTNGWFHFVFTLDTTLSTAGDRIKLYINGVRETEFDSSYGTMNPALNKACRMNENGKTVYMGQRGNSAQYWTGSMSHIHFVDGTAYQADTFGSTDSTTGEWKINTSPTVTYGNHGWFILKDGNSVTDQSGNGNNCTASGTLTKTEDNPSNVFATYNSVFPASGHTLSRGNTQATVSGSSWIWRPSTLGATTGKYYAEIRVSSAGGGTSIVGITNIDDCTGYAPSDTHFGKSAVNSGTLGFAWYSDDGKIYYPPNASTSVYGTWGASDILMLAMDLDNGAFYIGKNGSWLNSGNPASAGSRTGAVRTWTAGTGTWVFADAIANGSVLQWNWGNGYFGQSNAVSSAGTNASGIGIFEYDVPAGYTALSTKGLNE